MSWKLETFYWMNKSMKFLKTSRDRTAGMSTVRNIKDVWSRFGRFYAANICRKTVSVGYGPHQPNFSLWYQQWGSDKKSEKQLERIALWLFWNKRGCWRCSLNLWSYFIATIITKIRNTLSFMTWKLARAISTFRASFHVSIYWEFMPVLNKYHHQIWCMGHITGYHVFNLFRR